MYLFKKGSGSVKLCGKSWSKRPEQSLCSHRKLGKLSYLIKIRTMEARGKKNRSSVTTCRSLEQLDVQLNIQRSTWTIHNNN